MVYILAKLKMNEENGSEEKQMRFADFFSKGGMMERLEEAANKPNSFIIDVRTKEEYDSGHIPKSVNVALSEIERIGSVVHDMNAPIYVYCQSGARSQQAAAVLKRMGYEDVTNMGGMMSYKGKIER